MMTTKILTYSVSDNETVADLQQRIEKDANIPVANQELLLEAGLALEPQGLAAQCAIDYAVMSNITLWHKMNTLMLMLLRTLLCLCLQEIDGRRTDLPLVFLFDRSSCNYAPQFTPRTLPENIRFVREYSLPFTIHLYSVLVFYKCSCVKVVKNYILYIKFIFLMFWINMFINSYLCFFLENDPSHILPYSPLRRTCGQAWHTIRSLKEDWQRLQQGQKAAMYDTACHK